MSTSALEPNRCEPTGNLAIPTLDLRFITAHPNEPGAEGGIRTHDLFTLSLSKGCLSQ